MLSLVPPFARVPTTLRSADASLRNVDTKNGKEYFGLLMCSALITGHTIAPPSSFSSASSNATACLLPTTTPESFGNPHELGQWQRRKSSMAGQTCPQPAMCGPTPQDLSPGSSRGPFRVHIPMATCQERACSGVGMLVAVSELRPWLAGASCDDHWSGALEAGFSPVQH